MTAPRPTRLLRYGVVGMATLALYLALGRLMHSLEAPLFWEASLPFVAAVAFNYLTQRGWVFEDSRPAAASLPKYLVMIGIGFVINLLALLAFSERMPLLLAQLMAVVLVVASNAIFAFAWVFFRPGSPRA